LVTSRQAKAYRTSGNLVLSLKLSVTIWRKLVSSPVWGLPQQVQGTRRKLNYDEETKF